MTSQSMSPSMPAKVIDHLLSCLDWRTQRVCERVCRRWHRLLRSRVCCDSTEPNGARQWTVCLENISAFLLPKPGWVLVQDVGFCRFDENGGQVEIYIVTEEAIPVMCADFVGRVFCQLPIAHVHMRSSPPLIRQIFYDQLAKGAQLHVQQLDLLKPTFTSLRLLPNLRVLSLSQGEIQLEHLPAKLRKVHLGMCFFPGRTATELLADFVAAAEHLEEITICRVTPAIDENVIIGLFIENRRHCRTIRLLKILNLGARLTGEQSQELKEQYVRFIHCVLDERVNNNGVDLDVFSLEISDGVFPINEFNTRFRPLMRSRTLKYNDEGEEESLDLDELEIELENVQLDEIIGFRATFDNNFVIEIR